MVVTNSYVCWSPFREVVVNMLLRLVEHSRVMVLLTYVLDCYRRNTQKWQEVCVHV